ncbi:hypothetical protein CEXT_593561 [Caerostris extrusa]|uniref:Uncharacterized protein n=1 Tax=Caerostris extrusa TaxID=172846 RepID=A0AAV4N415_CAEEX|nr:hypothetical protein CEXT_593561 [Caerostris extrusa]
MGPQDLRERALTFPFSVFLTKFHIVHVAVDHPPWRRAMTARPFPEHLTWFSRTPAPDPFPEEGGGERRAPSAGSIDPRHSLKTLLQIFNFFNSPT